MRYRVSLACAIVLAVWAAAPAAAFAQGAAEPDDSAFRILFRGDSAYVYVRDYGASGQGFVVYRRRPGEADFERRTPVPIQPITSPDSVEAVLGDAFDYVADKFSTRNPSVVARRLRSDRFEAQVLVAIFPRAGQVAGRVFVDGGVTPGITYEYRVVYTGPDGQETVEAGRQTVQAVERRPAHVEDLSVERTLRVTEVAWRYDPQDDVAVRMDVVRRAADETDFFRVNEDFLVVRSDTDAYSIIDRSADPSRAYEYLVTTRSPVGIESQPVTAFAPPARDATPPSPVTGIRAVQTGPVSVSVVWSTGIDLDVVGYHVYRGRSTRDTSDIRLTRRPLMSTMYADSTLRPLEQYVYRVTAVDTAGNQSEKTGGAVILVRDLVPPAAVDSLTAVLRDGGTDLSWVPSASDDVMGHVVLRRGSGAPYTRLRRGLVVETQVRDTLALRPGSAYRYAVIPVDRSDQRGDTTFVDVAIPDDVPPDPPGRVVVRNERGRRVMVTFDPSLSLDVAHYEVRRTAVEGVSVDLATIQRDESRTLTDAGVERGVTYRWEVVGVDAAGNRSAPSSSDELTFRDSAPPPAPRGLMAYVEGDSVVVTWQPVPEPDLAGYYVIRFSGADVNRGPLISETRYAETIPIEPGDSADTGSASARRASIDLSFRIIAVDTSGNVSRPSSPVSVR